MRASKKASPMDSAKVSAAKERAIMRHVLALVAYDELLHNMSVHWAKASGGGQDRRKLRRAEVRLQTELGKMIAEEKRTLKKLKALKPARRVRSGQAN